MQSAKDSPLEDLIFGHRDIVPNTKNIKIYDMTF